MFLVWQCRCKTSTCYPCEINSLIMTSGVAIKWIKFLKAVLGWSICEKHVSTVCSTVIHLSAMWHLITHWLWSIDFWCVPLLGTMQWEETAMVKENAAGHKCRRLSLCLPSYQPVPVPPKLNIWHYLLTGQVNWVKMKSMSKERISEKWVLGFELYFTAGVSLF